MLSLETSFQGPEMCSVILTVFSALKPCRQGNGNWGNSVAHINPKIPNTLSLTLKRASCNDRFLTADDGLLPQLQRELSMNQLLRTRGSLHTDRYGLSHNFSHQFFLSPHSYFETHFSSMVNDTKWTHLRCWQCTNRRCLLRALSDHLLSFWVSTRGSLH